MLVRSDAEKLCETVNVRYSIGTAPATALIDRRSEEGAGAFAGAVVLAVALIVVPAGTPAPKTNVGVMPPAAGRATLPPDAEMACVVLAATGVGVACGIERAPPPPPHAAAKHEPARIATGTPSRDRRERKRTETLLLAKRTKRASVSQIPWRAAYLALPAKN